jgi:L-fucose mutarotase/ribose pyranase (RbsD/FucU family)
MMLGGQKGQTVNVWMRRGLETILLIGLCAGCAPLADPGRREVPGDWRRVLEQRLPAYGHRNWIVIADSAYPSQSRAGIETVATGSDHLEAVRAVLAELGKSQHVRPIVYVDAELPHVAEQDAPGIGAYRDALKKVSGERPVQSLPHEQIIDRLNKAGEKFNVLILKTSLTLPYTSVFLELDCGYWSAEAEQRLREVMARNK